MKCETHCITFKKQNNIGLNIHVNDEVSGFLTYGYNLKVDGYNQSQLNCIYRNSNLLQCLVF